MDVPTGPSAMDLPHKNHNPPSSNPMGRPPKSSPLREKSDSSSTISKLSPRSTPQHRPTSNTFYASIYDLSRGSAKEREDEAVTNESTYSEGSTPDTQNRIKSARGRLLKAKTTLSASMSNLQKKIPLARKLSHHRNRSASDPVSSGPQNSTGTGSHSVPLERHMVSSTTPKYDAVNLPAPHPVAGPSSRSPTGETEGERMHRLYAPNLHSHMEEDPDIPRPQKQKTSSHEFRRPDLAPRRVKSKSDSEGSPPGAHRRKRIENERSKYTSPGVSPSSSRGVSPAPKPQVSKVSPSSTIQKNSPESISPLQRMAKEGMTISPLRRGSSVPVEISSPTKRDKPAERKESPNRVLKGHQNRRSSSPADLEGLRKPNYGRQGTSNSKWGGQTTPPDQMHYSPSPPKQVSGQTKSSPNGERADSVALDIQNGHLATPPNLYQVEPREARRTLVFPADSDLDFSQYDDNQDENFWKGRAKELFSEIREERNRQRDMVELINSYERLRESSERDVLSAFRAAESTMQRKEKRILVLEEENARLRKAIEESEGSRVKAMEDLSLLSIKYRDYFQRMQSDMTAALKEKDREIEKLKTQNEEVKEQGEALLVAVMERFGGD